MRQTNLQTPECVNECIPDKRPKYSSEHLDTVMIEARIKLNDGCKAETARVVNAALAISLKHILSKSRKTKAEQRLVEACVAYAEKAGD